MLSKAENQLVTETGKDRPMGDIMRRYWQPAALSEELTSARPAVAVKLAGEDLVLFRDSQDRLGLIGRHCPHRGVDLCYGRLEHGGLRCPFHGWLFDVEGRCLEQPAEPAGSRFHEKIHHTAYPCKERNGIIFAYLGPAPAPELPVIDAYCAPGRHSFAFKGHLACNWLQALEVGIDPAHASFLHRTFQDDDPADGYGLQFRDSTDGATDKTSRPVTEILRNYPAPHIRVSPQPYGLRIAAERALNETSSARRQTHVRVTNLLFPNAIAIPMSRDMTITQWHVPIDDENCWWYAIFTSFTEPVDKAQMRAQRLQLYSLPDYRSRRNRSNNYGYDPEEQRTRTYTGMGDDINVHDQWAVESPGPIADRSREHLGSTDRAIIASRKLLLATVKSVSAAQPLPIDPAYAGAADDAFPYAIDTIIHTDTADASALDRETIAAAQNARLNSAWAGGLHDR